MFTLYSMQRSGNSYKARLALAQLGIPYRLVEIDILKGESHTPEFLLKNPNGQVPLLEVAPGRYLAEFERDPLVHRRRHAARAREPHRQGRRAAVDVLRAAQPGAELGRGVFLADPHQGRPRAAKPRHRGLDGRRPSRAWRDGQTSRLARLLRGRSLHHRRHRACTPTPMWRTYAAMTFRRFPAVRAWLARVAAEPRHVTMDFNPTATMPAL